MEKVNLGGEDMNKTFKFRDIECWLETRWIDGIFHFNFAPLENDYVDDDGDIYFIHCTYEPDEEDKIWFSHWYEHDCTEAHSLTEDEREYIKKEIYKAIK